MRLVYMMRRSESAPTLLFARLRELQADLVPPVPWIDQGVLPLPMVR
jgi:hypothetical protein